MLAGLEVCSFKGVWLFFVLLYFFCFLVCVCVCGLFWLFVVGFFLIWLVGFFEYISA